jgi:Co/Zn/Cd efflux system component
MTQFPNTDTKDLGDPKKQIRPWTALGVIASVLISSTLLIWAVSLPFRRASSSTRIVTAEKDAKITVQQQRSEAERIRETAMMQHRDFLYRLKKQKQQKLQRELPGRDEAQRQWSQRSESMKSQIAELSQAIVDVDAPEGSILWENRKQLVKISSDSGE